MDVIKERILNTPEVEPDTEDLSAMKRIKKSKDTDKGISLDEMRVLKAEQEFSGKISLRVPKSLHRNLVNSAKEEGISLNQYILYKLAK